ncbi:tRNA (adenine-N(6)-)-methyltransferase [Ruminococcus sp.]|uniref:tRNA (adenine-N(6)-)-methyltransferase n=1 Tax=Ruminococcus sp. TaxID=41978 RepID=UPI0025F1FE66|nr:tRNA (adenine-N(6)-)-methyltransferase [Ruminococcus sp.]MBR1431814.1 tRNA (adenine-N(6)-)-methyltransferase [Ruminococcus sp.]
MAINIGYLTANRTSAGDEVYTPFYAVEPLTEFLPEDKVIWCPFDEEWSAYYRLLSEKGYTVVRSSLKEGQDFFTYEPEKWDILVSNPPFSKKDNVLQRAFSFDKPFALLLPVNSIQGKRRYRIFRNRIQMLVFDGRVDYHTRKNMQETTKGNHFGSAYFCRDLLPTKLELRQLNKYERPLLSPTGGDEKWE